GFQKHRLLIHAHPAAAVMHRIGRIGVDECAVRHERRTVGLAELLDGGRRRKEIGKEENPQREAEARAEQAAEEKDQHAPPETPHRDSPFPLTQKAESYSPRSFSCSIAQSRIV